MSALITWTNRFTCSTSAVGMLAKQASCSLIFSHHDLWQDYKSVSHPNWYCIIMAIKGYFSLLYFYIWTTVKLVDNKNIKLKHPYPLWIKVLLSGKFYQICHCHSLLKWPHGSFHCRRFLTKRTRQPVSIWGRQKRNHANTNGFKENAKHALRVKPYAHLENSPGEGRVFVLFFGSQSFICCLRV